MASEDCYKMTSRPRGICVIIDNAITEEDIPHSQNNQLVKTFENLHFSVKHYTRLTHSAFEDVLSDLSDTDHSDYDCVVLFITAHGDEDVVCGVDDKDITIDELTDYLKPLQCPSLAGKPKVIFLEACRGGDSQYPTVVEDVPDAAAFPETHFPNEADFVFGYSTVKTFVSYNGSYRKIVADTLSQRAHRDHLADILTEVNRKMSEIAHLTRDGTRVHQTSEMTSRLRKKVFFNQ